MTVEFKYCEKGNLDYIKVTVVGEDAEDNKVTLVEAITPHDLLRAAADLIDHSPYYKSFFDERLLG